MKKKDHKIYYAYFNNRLLPSNFQSLIDSMPASMQQKALSYRRWEDAHAYVLGRKLLEQVITANSHPYSLDSICYNAFGRPFIEGFEDFNISHSGNLVVCAFTGGGRIGIDVEMRKPLEIDDFINQFSATEWNNIQQAASPLDVFYDYWTAKEAVLKADGRGLNSNLAECDVSSGHKTSLEQLVWYLHAIPNFENYACHIACSEPNINYTLTDMTPWCYSR